MPTLPRLKDQRKTRYRYRQIRYEQDDYRSLYGTTQWSNIRNRYRREHPICECCEYAGYIEAMSDVHHIIPFSTGYNRDEQYMLMIDEDNIVSVCRQCHNDIHNILYKNKNNIVTKQQLLDGMNDIIQDRHKKINDLMR